MKVFIGYSLWLLIAGLIGGIILTRKYEKLNEFKPSFPTQRVFLYCYNPAKLNWEACLLKEGILSREALNKYVRFTAVCIK